MKFIHLSLALAVVLVQVHGVLSAVGTVCTDADKDTTCDLKTEECIDDGSSTKKCTLKLPAAACSDNPDCKNGGTCDKTKTPNKCLCAPGFSGVQCEAGSAPPAACSDNADCKNGGTCDTSKTPNECLCVTGFSGAKCETEHRGVKNNTQTPASASNFKHKQGNESTTAAGKGTETTAAGKGSRLSEDTSLISLLFLSVIVITFM